ncbi:XAC2610-related protein [Acidicapsa dinghuensis]|uniref:XAC2610-related protein n=1 Tax=Acidicapsa dinghuensis TaxID=2218256 RepID=A0ABW1EFE0_9BACT|nr:hypothetical protein [Acidicapsa dinghuensis]
MRLWMAAVAVLAVLQGATPGNMREFSGRVGPEMPNWTFRSTFGGSTAASEDQIGDLTRVDVLSGGQTLQSIEFSDDESPASFGPPEEQVELRDVDCDGYKDLLILKSVGYGGVNTWNYLYRYNVHSGKFERYPPFEEQPFVDVNCKTKTVHFYDRDGWAGCLYEEQYSRWVGGELKPARLVIQDPEGDDRVMRTIYIWRGGKKVVLSKRSYPVKDCHANESKFMK